MEHDLMRSDAGSLVPGSPVRLNAGSLVLALELRAEFVAVDQHAVRVAVLQPAGDHL